MKDKRIRGTGRKAGKTRQKNKQEWQQGGTPEQEAEYETENEEKGGRV